MEDPPDVDTLISGLLSDSDSTRKYAVFRLQSLLSYSAFAEAFIQRDGLLALREVIMQAGGNTEAYALGSLNKLLEVDLGWEGVDGGVVEKAVLLAVGQQLVNIVRAALTLLVHVVSHPQSGTNKESLGVFGFRAIKPALDNHPEFLESLVLRLSASDHTLCANALQLINALLRDAIMNGGTHEWPKFIKRLQDLGVIGGVGMLMRGDAATDVGGPLAAAILEFQYLTMLLLKKWKEVRVNMEFHEHKKALKTIHLLSRPDPYNAPATNGETTPKSRKHHPEKWRRLGFETESPAWEFEESGYLGMMDLVDFAKRNEDDYHKIILEQSAQTLHERCPLARASLSVTLILFEHFEIEDTAVEFENFGQKEELQRRVTEAQVNGTLDRLYRPLLLQWSRLHTAALNTWIRMWKASGAEAEDFYKVEEVVRIIVEHIVGVTTRKTEVAKVEDELRNVNLDEARKWQMDGLDEVYDDAWGPHLVSVREQLHHESVQFMKEQRIRCLLQGSWFPATAAGNGGWRFVRLSHNRRWLHHRNYPSKGTDEPPLTELPERIDLNSVTSVNSNVSSTDRKALLNGTANGSTETLTNARHDSHPTTKITIMGYPTPKTSYKLTPVQSEPAETILLDLFPPTSTLASEWLDGLLMLLNQQPITKDTTRLIDMMEDWGVRLRMLNLRWEDVDWEALEMTVKGERVEKEVPSREGLDEEYWYAVPET